MYKKILLTIGISMALVACQNQPEQSVTEEAEQETYNEIEGCLTEIAQEEDISTITIDTENGITILTFDENAVLMDCENKCPVLPIDLKPNTKIKAYISPAMTLSEPPRVSAYVILSSIDQEAPDYVVVKEVKQSEDSIKIIGQDKEYELPKNSQVSPYKTKNIVTIDDITSGKEILIWPQSNIIMLIH